MAMLDANQQGRGVHIRLLSSTRSGVWVNSQSVNRKLDTRGAVRNYAGGKRRAITWGATSRNVEVDLTFNSRADMETVASWVDRTVLVRTVRGEVLAGLLSNVSTAGSFDIAVEWLGGSITVQETTDDGTIPSERRR